MESMDWLFLIPPRLQPLRLFHLDKINTYKMRTKMLEQLSECRLIQCFFFSVRSNKPLWERLFFCNFQWAIEPTLTWYCNTGRMRESGECVEWCNSEVRTCQYLNRKHRLSMWSIVSTNCVALCPVYLGGERVSWIQYKQYTYFIVWATWDAEHWKCRYFA